MERISRWTPQIKIKIRYYIENKNCVEINNRLYLLPTFYVVKFFQSVIYPCVAAFSDFVEFHESLFAHS